MTKDDRTDCICSGKDYHSVNCMANQLSEERIRNRKALQNERYKREEAEKERDQFKRRHDDMERFLKPLRFHDKYLTYDEMKERAEKAEAQAEEVCEIARGNYQDLAKNAENHFGIKQLVYRGKKAEAEIKLLKSSRDNALIASQLLEKKVGELEAQRFDTESCSNAEKRIKELQAEVKKLQEDNKWLLGIKDEEERDFAKRSIKGIKELQAKLSKALEALKEIRGNNTSEDQDGMIASIAIYEIEGEG